MRKAYNITISTMNRVFFFKLKQYVFLVKLVWHIGVRMMPLL